MPSRGLQISIIVLVIIIFAVGGTFVVDRMNTPTTPAFLNDFTAEFLVKDAETPDGFHLFESGTGKYTILFPEEYVIAESSYYRKKASGSGSPDTENVYLSKDGVSPKENRMIQSFNLFLNPDGNSVIDARLDGIRSKLGAPEDSDFTKKELEDKTIYYLEYIDEYETEDGGKNTYDYLYGYIVDNNSKQALHVEQKNVCMDSDTRECPINFVEEHKMGLKMMESVDFK
ncbi:hypothetical protein [Paucisalibacillus globulus]|uniref:hypothetical protein n=1 Tax=Paucisalibacillus globulus TaxID=351095 RepID=UPI00040E1447|nr:hypothetical protein [Paucisalibacillus globulus]